MASWRVEFDGVAAKTMVDLVDSFGPNNDWKAHDPTALVPSKGKFTNQTNTEVPTEQPTWQLNQFDIDKMSVGDTGAGEVFHNDGTFPTGSMTWKVIQKL
jgi:hypothetical protein